MNDKNLSEKFARLVIETALQTNGAEFHAKLVEEIAAATSKQLASLRTELQALKNSQPPGVDPATLQRIKTLLETRVAPSSGESERRETELQKLNAAVFALQSEVAKLQEERWRESEMLSRAIARLEGLDQTVFDRDRQRQSKEPEVPLANTNSDSKDHTLVSGTQVAACRDSWFGPFKSRMSAAAGVLLILMAVMLLHFTWTGPEHEPQAANSGRSHREMGATGGRVTNPAPQAPLRPFPVVSDPAVDYLDRLVGVLEERLDAEQRRLLVKKLDQIDADISNGELRTSLSMRLLDDLTQGTEGKQIAVWLLQALLVEEGQPPGKIEKKLSESAEKSLLRISCVGKGARNDTRGARNEVNPRPVDLSAQLPAIINACAAE